MTTTMQQRPYSWKERLKDSSWVTVAWDWFMTFLGRVVEAALWVTMVFSCYQLIPGAPQPAPIISNTIFIIQFVSLDVGGIGLNKLAQSQGLAQWSYTRIIAYILIGLTLVTVAYAGLQHVVTTIPLQVTSSIEVSLVVARSVMTVLYGQAIHSLKHEIRKTGDTVTEREAEVSSLRVQLDARQQEVDTLRERLHSASGEVSALHQALDSKQQEMNSLHGHLDSGQQQHGQGASLDTGRTEQVSRSERVIVLDRRRAARSQPSAGGNEQQEELTRRIQELLDHEPGLSGRAIATRLGCSPTTASKWKAHIEQERQRNSASAH